MCASLRSVASATAMGESDRKRSNRRNKWVRVGRRKAKVGERRERESKGGLGGRRKEEGPKPSTSANCEGAEDSATC